MNELLSGIRAVNPALLFAFFMISQWGWWCFFGKQSNTNLFLLPSLSACFQITVLICTGMMGHLLFSVNALFFFGLLYLLYTFLRRRNPLQFLPVTEILYFVCMIVIVFLATKGRLIYDHDNFSHWATVLKELLRTDQFPDGSRMMTEHFTYPIGSAVWIYFLVKLTNANTESAWMFGQALLMIYCILPCFCFLRKKPGVIYTALYFVLILLLSNCFLCYNIGIYNLMVDTLFPLVGAAASVFAYCVDSPLQNVPVEKSARFSRGIWFLTPFLCALIQIKTPGILLAVAAVTIILCKPSVRKNKYQIIQTGVVACTSFLPLIMWKIYCSIHFSGMTAKHDISISWFRKILSQKTPDNISTIFFNATKYFLTSPFFIEFFLVLAVIFILVFLIANDSDLFQSALAWSFILIVYLVYTFSTVGMFIFSMPLAAALNLASIDRYQRTILVYCFYILFCTLFCSLSNIDLAFVRKDIRIDVGGKKEGNIFDNATSEETFKYSIAHVNNQNCTESGIYWMRIFTISCAIILLSLGWYKKYDGRFRVPSDTYGGGYIATRHDLEDTIRKAGIPQYAKCIVLKPKNDWDYRAVLAFLLGTDRRDITLTTIDSTENLQKVDEALMEDAWVIIVDNENPYIQDWLSKKDSLHILVMD